MIFRETPLPGAGSSTWSRAPTTAASSPGTLPIRGVRRRRSERRGRSNVPVRTYRAVPCAACTSRSPRTPRRKLVRGASVAPSSTSSSACARSRRPGCSTWRSSRAFYVPPTHAYQTLTDDTEAEYQVSGSYEPSARAASRRSSAGDPVAAAGIGDQRQGRVLAPMADVAESLAAGDGGSQLMILVDTALERRQQVARSGWSRSAPGSWVGVWSTRS